MCVRSNWSTSQKKSDKVRSETSFFTFEKRPRLLSVVSSRKARAPTFAGDCLWQLIRITSYFIQPKAVWKMIVFPAARGLDCLSASGARKEHIKCRQCQPQKTHGDTREPTIKTHQLEKLTCLMFLWRRYFSMRGLGSISARRFLVMQNLSNSPLCLVRTMPAFLRPGNFIVLLAQQCRLPWVFVWDSYHSRPSYDGFFIRWPSASWHSSPNALHLFLSVCFLRQWASRAVINKLKSTVRGARFWA